jgi:hypothetical protein
MIRRDWALVSLDAYEALSCLKRRLGVRLPLSIKEPTISRLLTFKDHKSKCIWGLHGYCVFVSYSSPDHTLMSIDVSTRRQMAETLDAVMNSSYAGLVDELKLKRGHSLLKTYLVEAHTSRKASQEDLLQLLKNSFEKSKKGSRLSAIVSETHDAKLFKVQGTGRREKFIFFVDAADSRFWLTHSIARSEVSDVEIESLLRSNQQLDSAWMPAELLNKIQGFGESRGLGLDFDRRYFDAPIRRRSSKSSEKPHLDDDGTELRRVTKADHFEYVKMQLWGTGAQRILTALADADLGNSTTVSKVRLKTQSSEDSKLFSLTDVKFDGKITGRGTSFDVYNALLIEILKRYSNAILRTESIYKLSWVKDGVSAKISGEPLYISLGEGIDDLEYFCLKVFSGHEPFRLLGRPIRRNSNFFTVSAIDLHINQRVDFEISRNTMTIFLPQATCGNSVMRLYTNLQHYLSSDVKAIDASGARIFTFES